MDTEKTLETIVKEVAALAPLELVLTEEQQAAVTAIESWFAMTTPNGEFKLGGYAGTGKTTLIKEIRKRIKAYVVVCAFTGKAVHVLNKKGVSASTMHSLMYNVIPEGYGQVRFELRDRLEYGPKLVIVDEASMISSELYADLKSFNVPILFVGDPGQLEPVGDNPNLMRKPDLVLSKILRQAEANPIIALANKVRTNKGQLPSFLNLPELRIKTKKGLDTNQIVNSDQIICARNITRKSLNHAIRTAKGLPYGQFSEGEKIIVLRNNQNYNVFNGQIFFVKTILKDSFNSWECLVVDELGVERTIPLWKEPFEGDLPKEFSVPKGLVYADFGYVITCHKSQGSEWDHVVVYDEWMPPKVWDMAKWRYTAITRAAKQLSYFI